MPANPSTDLTPGDVTAPAAPSSIVVTPHGKGLQITLIVPIKEDDFREYEIQRAVGAGAFDFFARGDATVYPDNGVSYGTLYFYRARSIDWSGNQSAFTASFSGIPVRYVTDDIGDDQVSRPKIQNLAINDAKIDSLAVKEAKIDNLAVKTAKIDDLQVTTIKIGTNAVTNFVSASAGGFLGFFADAVEHEILLLPAISVSGFRVLLNYDIQYTVTNVGATTAKVEANFRIKRNGVTIETHRVVLPTAAAATGFNLYTLVLSSVHFDTPPAGVYTYTIDVDYFTPGGFPATDYTITIEGRHMKAEEFKR